MAEFVGTYKLVGDDGKFDDFLKAIGVGLLTRKVAVATKPSIELSVKDDGTIVVKTVSTFKNTTLEFKLGEEFKETRMDGVDCKTIVVKEGNKLIQKQDSNPSVEIIREFNGDKMTTTCICGTVKCVREYKKD